MPRLVECVPNVSEGRDRAVIDAIAQAIAGVSGVKLLDVDPGADTNRTVYTFVGEPDAVAEAAFRAGRRAVDLIDMGQHRGAHPRIGAMDVCPFVPVAGVSMDDCVAIARAVGERIGRELDVPVYFYECAATREERRSLATIRSGEYEGLQRKLEDPSWQPDAGPVRFHPRAGAFVVGAREFLLAYNVNLNTTDRRLANDIALTIREGGRIKRDAGGHPVVGPDGQQEKLPGRLKAVRAIGWYIDQYRQAQVSINLLSFTTTPLHVVFDTVREEAEKRGLIVTGSELVGMTPLEPLLEAGRHYLRRQGKSAGVPEADLVRMAVRSLGLDQVAPFEPEKKVIEYQVREPEPLVAMTVRGFVDEVSTESPAPGGGSVAALAGSLAAGLAAMVANLTVGKKGYEAAWEDLSALAGRAQEVKASLLVAIDEDTRAFNRVLDAMRLPKATLEQSEARTTAVQRAYEGAARVPMQTAEHAVSAIALAREVAERGNKASLSDAGVAALAGRCAVEGAVLNVLINLGAITDEAFRAEARRRVDVLVARARSLCDETLGIVKAAIE